VEHLREQLHTLIDEHETTLEEFKSANAEILSANEELQSSNEELETTKEELQSSNEELSTLNEELQNSNAELTQANNDQLNLMTNVNLPVVMVGNDLRIRRFTPPAEKLMNLLPGDLGRRLGEIRSNIEPDDLEQVARTTIENAVFQEREVRVKDGPWYMLRVRPYKTWDDKIEGAVLSFQDIDSLKRTLDQTRTFAEALIENARESVLVLDEGLHVTLANPVFYRTFQVSPEETKGRPIHELGNRQWDIPKLRELFQKITTHNARIDGYEVRHKFQHLGTRHMILNARRIESQGGPQMILLSIEDVTRKNRNAGPL
jgi:two-component system CheB/CheR fusion protein